jgi:hypothetical protein
MAELRIEVALLDGLMGGEYMCDLQRCRGWKGGSVWEIGEGVGAAFVEGLNLG